MRKLISLILLCAIAIPALGQSSGGNRPLSSSSSGGDIYGANNLRNWRSCLASIRWRTSTAVAGTVCVLGLMGDSLTAGNASSQLGYPRTLMPWLWGKYGYAGAGWISASGGAFNFSPVGTNVGTTGTWTSTNNGQTSG